MATVLAGTLTATVDDFFSAGDFVASKYTASATGTADQMSVLLRTPTSSFTSLTLAIYADSAGSPGAKLGQCTPITNTAAGTQTAALTSTVAISSGTVYWLAALSLGGNYNARNNSTGGGYKGRSGVSAITDPFGSTSFSDATSVCVTAESSGVGAPASIVRRQVIGQAVKRAATWCRRTPRGVLAPDLWLPDRAVR